MKTKTAIVFLLIFSLVGCGANQVLANLQLALDAVSLALPIVGAYTGAPPELITSIVTYCDQANTALGQAAPILSGPGTDAQKAAQITALFASIAVPDVPAKYAPLVALVATLAGDIAKFLASLPAAPASKTLAASKPSTTTLSSADRLALVKCVDTSAANRAKLLGMKKR